VFHRAALFWEAKNRLCHWRFGGSPGLASELRLTQPPLQR